MANDVLWVDLWCFSMVTSKMTFHKVFPTRSHTVAAQGGASLLSSFQHRFRWWFPILNTSILGRILSIFLKFPDVFQFSTILFRSKPPPFLGLKNGQAASMELWPTWPRMTGVGTPTIPWRVLIGWEIRMPSNTCADWRQRPGPNLFSNFQWGNMIKQLVSDHVIFGDQHQLKRLKQKNDIRQQKIAKVCSSRCFFLHGARWFWSWSLLVCHSLALPRRHHFWKISGQKTAWVFSPLKAVWTSFSSDKLTPKLFIWGSTRVNGPPSWRLQLLSLASSREAARARSISVPLVDKAWSLAKAAVFFSRIPASWTRHNFDDNVWPQPEINIHEILSSLGGPLWCFSGI